MSRRSAAIAFVLTGSARDLLGRSEIPQVVQNRCSGATDVEHLGQLRGNDAPHDPQKSALGAAGALQAGQRPTGVAPAVIDGSEGSVMTDSQSPVTATQN